MCVCIARYGVHALVGVAHVHGWVWHMHTAWCGTSASTFTHNDQTTSYLAMLTMMHFSTYSGTSL